MRNSYHHLTDPGLESYLPSYFITPAFYESRTVAYARLLQCIMLVIVDFSEYLVIYTFLSGFFIVN